MSSEPAGKTLYILRHATTLSSAGQEDLKRILSGEGKQEAFALGKAMEKQSYLPDLVLCSPAMRTRETLAEIQKTFSLSCVIYEDVIYNGSTDDLLELINETENKYSSALIIGHNPCIYQLAISLAGSGPAPLFQSLQTGYKPATLTALRSPVSRWGELRFGECEIFDVLAAENYNENRAASLK